MDAAAVDNSSRISPDNNLDFYPYSQAAPYNVSRICRWNGRMNYRCLDAAIDR